MKYPLQAALLALIVVGCAHPPSPIPSSGREGRCERYARLAVKQHQENLNKDCGFKDPRWHVDHEAHFHWCLMVPPEVSDLENDNRQAMLDRCKNNESPDCGEYARTAVRQHELNMENNCGFDDPRFHHDYDAHFNFCLEVPRDVSSLENQDRQAVLDECLKGKTSSSPPTRFSEIPENKKTRLAVIRFKALNKVAQTRNLGSMISEIFTTEAVNSRAFKIVEREQLNKVLKEYQISQSGIIDTRQAQEIGKMLGADAIITGSVMKIGVLLRIDARIIRIKTGVIVSAVSRQCREDLNEISENVIRMTMVLAEKFYQ